MSKEKRIITILMILTVVFTIIGGTFAYWSWRTTDAEKTNITFTITSDFSCSADGGGNITSSDVNLIPTVVSSTTTANYIKREIKVTPTINTAGKTIYMDLWLDINKLDSGLSNSVNFKYAFTTSSTSNTTGVVAEGTFNSKVAGDKVLLLNAQDFSATATNTYYLWIWLDAKETDSSTMNQTFSLSLNGSCYDHKQITAESLIENANPSTLLYSDATDSQKGEMWAFSQPETVQLGATTDYRYIGNVPNNYITFNDEVWRIIGVFDGRIKIMRDEHIFASWDSKVDVGSATNITCNDIYGSSDWTDAQLMYMLNPTSYTLKSGYTSLGVYIKDANGNIIYQLGCMPTSIASGATSYDCINNIWSLNSTALSQISEATYYLGETSTGDSTTSYYSSERGTSYLSTSWSGLVGLMYASDYGYAFANGVDDTCYNDPSSCDESNPSNSWIFNSEYQWTISMSSTCRSLAFISKEGRISEEWASSGMYVSPVVYLKSDIKLQGSGTSGNPYVIIN